MKKISKILAISVLALTTIPTDVFATTHEATGIKALVPDSLTLTLNTDNLIFDLETPMLYTKKLTVTASTNAVSGYTISFNANNDYNDLKHSNALIEDKIESITEDKTEATFPETAWAYSTDLEDYVFKKIPLEAENIFTTTENGENNHDFTIGMRANDIVAGDYENELIFTAVANPDPEPASNLTDIDYMQEMTPEICAASAEHESKQLVDIRDDKKYWVTKLKDGNCWMTQNLDFDLDPSVTLTPEDTDVTENWTPIRATIAGIENLNSENWGNSNDMSSFDPGNYYFEGIYYRSSEECNYLTTTCDHYAQTPYTINGEHGHVGNFYNWNAAATRNDARNDSWSGNVDVENSICPKGWRLPYGGYSTQGNDFETLSTAYGVATDSDSVLLANPLFFVRTGQVYVGGMYSSCLTNGNYWTSTISGSWRSDFRFMYAGINIRDSWSADHGLSVRCVAK